MVDRFGEFAKPRTPIPYEITNLTGITNDELYSYDLRYRQMLSNGRVHDTDGFLFDGENTHYNTLK